MQLEQTTRDRIKSALGVAAIHVLAGFALVRGLGFQIGEDAREALKVFEVAPEPPPPPPTEPAKVEAKKDKAKAEKPEGAASPKNLRDTPAPIVAPPPAIVLPVPPVVMVAPVAAEGDRASAGASDVPGPGTGSGGQGTGLGSGDSGDGTGGGGGGGIDLSRYARRIKGAIYVSDWPRGRDGVPPSGIVHLRFVVAPNGRVPRCDITRSSGDAALDETTCRLIKRRFRYRPARDAEGRAIAQVIPGYHDWGLEPEPEPIDVEPDIPD